MTTVVICGRWNIQNISPSRDQKFTVNWSRVNVLIMQFY